MVCRLPYNLGVGGAMRAGYRYAIRGGYDVAVQIDADGQHDPAYLSALVDQLATSEGGGADLVIGARFAGEGDPYQVSLLRRLAMRLLAGTLSRMAKTRLTDVTSGFRVANRRAIARVRGPLPGRVPRRHRRVDGHRDPGRLHGHPGARPDAGAAGRPGQPDARSAPALYLSRAVVALALALVRRWPGRAHPAEELAVSSTVTLGIIGSAVVLLALFELLRRQRLREKYAVLWFFVALGVLVLAIFPGLLDRPRRPGRRRAARQPAVLPGQPVPAGAHPAAQLRAGPAGGEDPRPGRGGRPAAAGAGAGAAGPGARRLGRVLGLMRAAEGYASDAKRSELDQLVRASERAASVASSSERAS